MKRPTKKANPLLDPKFESFFRKALSGVQGPMAPLRSLSALYFQIKQARIRAANAAAGLVVPPVLIASVTRDCNLDCKGCYSKALRPASACSLSDERFEELFREAVDLGVGVIMIAGGEPLLRRGLLERAAKIPGPFMAVFTNGTLIDEAAMKLFEGSRMVPIFSIEGESASTAERRGAGVHEGCLEKMEELKRRGILYGASITLTSSNADEVLSKVYMKRLAGLGISALVLVEYVPVVGGTEGLVLSDRQKSKLLALEAAADLPFGIVALPGDEEAYGGCLAAGRGFIHLADDGRLEACPFAPFSDTGAGTMPLREALGSPRRGDPRAAFRAEGDQGGCALWNKRGWIAGFSSCSALPPLRAAAEVRAAAS